MTKRKARAKKTLRVRQVRSGIGYDRRQNATLRALGLARVGKVRVLPDNPEVRAMIAKITHLVTIEEPSADETARTR